MLFPSFLVLIRKNFPGWPAAPFSGTVAKRGGRVEVASFRDRESDHRYRNNLHGGRHPYLASFAQAIWRWTLEKAERQSQSPLGGWNDSLGGSPLVRSPWGWKKNENQKILGLRIGDTGTEMSKNMPCFAICIDTDDPDLLTPRMVYQVLPDESAAKSDYLRVVDNEGEDYLYPSKYFISSSTFRNRLYESFSIRKTPS